MQAGTYTLELYCEKDRINDDIHHWGEFPHEFIDEFGSKCRAMARRDGWLLRKGEPVLCPKCNPRRKIKNAKI